MLFPIHTYITVTNINEVEMLNMLGLRRKEEGVGR